MKKIIIAIFCIVGMIVGIGLGEFAASSEKALNFLAIGGEIGFKPFTVDFSFIQFTLGFWCKINLCGILCMVIFALISKKVLDWLKI